MALEKGCAPGARFRWKLVAPSQVTVITAFWLTPNSKSIRRSALPDKADLDLRLPERHESAA